MSSWPGAREFTRCSCRPRSAFVRSRASSAVRHKMPSTIADNARATRAGRSSPPGSLGVVAAFAAWAVGIGFAVPGRADQPAVIEGAGKEGKLVLYTRVEPAPAQIVLNTVPQKTP